MKAPSPLSLCAALAVMAGAGCGGGGRTDIGFQAREVGRPDAAWPAEARVRQVRPPEWPEKKVKDAEASAREAAEAGARCPMDLSFQDRPVLEVVSLISSRFGCEVSVSPAAAEFIRSRDLRVSSGASDISADLAFETLRGLLEARGLTVSQARNASTFGRPHFTVDRNSVVEASAPAPAR